jgi:bacterioferritin
MERRELIDMLNRDLAAEHVSIVRYLMHAFAEGEDSELGYLLKEIAREEMWHLDWLGDEIGERGAEPNMLLDLSLYPVDYTSTASALRSYIEWEQKVADEYESQIPLVDDPELKRVLDRERYESLVHKFKFEQALEELGPAAEEPLPQGEEKELSDELLDKLQRELDGEYQAIVQYLRHAFVFEEESCEVGKELEFIAMDEMKHLETLAEELIENGRSVLSLFRNQPIDMSTTLQAALEQDNQDEIAARDRYGALAQAAEVGEHPGLKVDLEKIAYQENYHAAQFEDFLEELEEPEAPAPEPAAEPEPEPKPSPSGKWTVGSLLDES